MLLAAKALAWRSLSLSLFPPPSPCLPPSPSPSPPMARAPRSVRGRAAGLVGGEEAHELDDEVGVEGAGVELHDGPLELLVRHLRRACVRACVRVRAYVRACVRACVRAWACVRARRACAVYISIHGFMRSIRGGGPRRTQPLAAAGHRTAGRRVRL